ncbi:hypothetical protein [Amycolatopsis sp. WAC 04197]|uniref:hypothetical protein n=1 Tax=Amycolatopsis sp. WAC 04197 TaxID=2203199 RepID=UPI0013154DDC|nr:hypothetical protein [Amycolatopsis sp. WAC 04197]
MPQEKDRRARVSAGYDLEAPLILQTRVTEDLNIEIAICSVDKIDDGISVTLDEAETNELVDKLWRSLSDLKQKRENKTWQRLARREH